MSARSRRRTAPATVNAPRTVNTPYRQPADAIRRADHDARRPFWQSGWMAAVGAGAALLLAVVAVVAVSGRSSATPATVEARALAEANSGGPVRVLTGGHHTVYHSDLPLPTAAAPRTDGRFTLVWFSGTWCEVCESMEPYVNATAARFGDRVILIEKAVDVARSDAARFRVRGTPTFVLLDPHGRELTRFNYQPAAAFESVLARLPAP
jgi:thiol-disulfide isomerase/thioredoxin